jgi:RHS repeat-associated protein
LWGEAMAYMNQPGNPKAPTDPSFASQSDHERNKDFQVSAPSISLPKGGGAIRGIGEKFAATPAGTGSMTIPIATSTGRSGFGPQLALSYDSGAGNSPFGLGWSLTVPSITRKTDKGLPQYQDAQESDVFIVSGAEDLVPVLSQNAMGEWVLESTPPQAVNSTIYHIKRYCPRVEGLFARIERWTNQADPGDTFWRSISRDNITTWYGKTKESRIADPADPTRIFRWLICESYDDKGNAIAYEYKEENSDNIDLSQVHEAHRTPHTRKANRYLKHIRYGNHTPYFPQLTANSRWPTLPGSSEWFFEVVFDYGEHDTERPTSSGEVETWPRRNDSFSTYRAGFEIRTYRLCQRVLMFHHFPLETNVGADCLVRSTDFTYSYEENPGDARNPIFSTLLSVTQCGCKRQASAYLRKSFPPIEFQYTQPDIDSTIYDVDPDSLENLPEGLAGGDYHWIDLDGEGLSGILTEQAQGWFYKRNLSPINLIPGNDNEWTQAKFGPVEFVGVKPNVAISPGHAQFMDLSGDGQPDLVVLDSPTPGFYEKGDGPSWNTFRPFTSRLNRSVADPNVRLVDLDGDGHTDVLITEDDALTWHRSLAEDGFGPARRVPKTSDEERGPALIFADGTQSVYLADLSGDGLSDFVRIRNGEVCYWPNLGYGRFGAKVTMDNAPWFDNPEQFDQRRVRLADIDGSGVTDIVYLHSDGVRLYFNQSGNSWSPPATLPSFPRIDDFAGIGVVDLLGNGTACLVWSSPLPGNVQRPMRYIDLMGGQKPHLLVKTINNLAAETQVRYTSSTKFYLQDKRDGNPWLTRLPFPVHVVERVETLDRISRNRFITRYAYHHGYFDGVEREFRGFGMVEQLDTEELAALGETGDFPDAANIDAASYVPTVLTKTWFHTGLFIEGGRISRHFEDDYYHEGEASEGVPGLSDQQLEAMLLPDTEFPATIKLRDGSSIPWQFTAHEIQEACRALKGSVLRKEVYALDGTGEQDRPYSASEQTFTIEPLQPRSNNKYSVFFVHPREFIEFHYERSLVDVAGTKVADPRVNHTVTVTVDGFGNVLKSVAIGYGRRQNLSPLQGDDRNKQEKRFLTYTENRVTNPVDEINSYRTPLPSESRTYELHKIAPDNNEPDITNLFGFDEIVFKVAQACDGQHDLRYEDVDAAEATANHPYRRLIEHARTIYRRDDLSAALPLGQLPSLGILFETHKLAFTPGLLTEVYGLRIDDAMLADAGGYVHSNDSNWWIPSGRIFLSPGATDTSAEELLYARQNFFLPRRYRDPFHTSQFNTETLVTFDDYQLLVTETRDALGNTASAVVDYRLLAPRVMTDPNGNRSEVVFDALGMVAGSAIMGKATENLGDSLANFAADLDDATVAAHLQMPLLDPYSILKDATARIVYDLFAYYRTKNQPDPQPVVVYTLARETHAADLQANEHTKFQHSFSYSDGFGRNIQKKIEAEAGPVPMRDGNGKIVVDAGGQPVMTPNDVSPRWVGTGWTVLNNKGKPVRQYEPFFTDAHRFEFDVKIGVSPVLFYDPVERVVATLHPDHTWEKVVFDAWQQKTWDVNDTVLLDPKLDQDVKSFFLRLPDAEYLPGWHQQRAGGDLGADEQDAANKAAVHSGTPSVAHADSLGRTFLTIVHNKFRRNGPIVEERYSTRVHLDIEGNQRAVMDANDRVVMRYEYDMLGARIHQASMEAGERWVLANAAGESIYAWDSRDHRFHTAYDPLHRPIETSLSEANGPERLIARTVYGETLPSPEINNLRGKVVEVFDQAGLVTTDDYDFKGNLRHSSRTLADDYKKLYDWNTDALQPSWEVFSSTTTYDALNRPVSVTMPDDSVYRPAFNEANLLDKIEINLRGDLTATPFVTDIDYNARGQRERIQYANGTSTKYDFDPRTLRLIHLKTTRASDSAAIQDLAYTYDPAGNITRIQDNAQQTIYFNNQVVTASNDYTYDAIYRLITAQGREHIGQLSQPQTTWDDAFQAHLAHPNDGQAMRRYTEQYEYEGSGNFQQVIHQAMNGDWTRSYVYNQTSLIEANKKSNRLSGTSVGGSIPEVYSYDAHGNITGMPHLTLMQCDFKDQLRATAQQVTNNGAPETTYYVYDSGGQRARKVTDRDNGTRKSERIYIGGFEVHREFDGNGTGASLERETLHVMDEKQRIALVETKTIDTASPVASQNPRIRYQFVNHLESASVELDDSGQIISYEEYSPYGSTSYQAGRTAAEIGLKRYRYTGMERDGETGFIYHGARYYAPWLGRWVSADPTGLTDGANLYVYVRSNPVGLIDPSGNDGRAPTLAQMERRLKEIDAEIAKTEAVLQGYEEAEARAQANLSKLTAAREAKKAELAEAHEAAYQAEQARTCAQRPDWCPDPPDSFVGQVLGSVFFSAVGVPKYYVKTEVSRKDMQNAQTGVEYFKARDNYLAAHANVAAGRFYEETTRFFGAAMEFAGALQSLAPSFRRMPGRGAPIHGPESNPIGNGGGTGGKKMKKIWGSKEPGGGKYDCVGATCGRSMRAGEVVTADEALSNAGFNQKMVNESKGLTITQAEKLFDANGKTLGPPVSSTNAKGDYAVIVPGKEGPHMVYGRRTAAGTFYIDDAQGRTVRYTGDAASSYLQRSGIVIRPIFDK